MQPLFVQRMGMGVSRWTPPDSTTTTLWVRGCAAGGGGYGTDSANSRTPARYGKRGQDTYFHTHPSVGAMFALAPDGTVCYFGEPHGLLPDQAVFLSDIPAGVTGFAPDTPYFPINITPTTCQLSLTPSAPPFGGQSPIVAGPIGTNPMVQVSPTWYGLQGGGGGGIIGDQGTPMGYWGFDGIGPDGIVDSFAVQGGAGSACYHMGGPGGINPLGGNSGAAFLDNGINGSNQTGAGGGGAAPVSASFDFGGTGGAAGAYGEVWLKWTPGTSYLCQVGWGGVGGAAGPGGYKGGDGGHGLLIIAGFK